MLLQLIHLTPDLQIVATIWYWLNCLKYFHQENEMSVAYLFVVFRNQGQRPYNH